MDYWARRDKYKDSELKKLDNTFSKDSKKLYNEVKIAVLKEINAFLGKYNTNLEGLLDNEELRSFREEVEHYALLASKMEYKTDYTKQRVEAWEKKLAVLAKRVRLSRLQALMVNLEQALIELGVEQDNLLNTDLSNFAQDAYNYTSYTIDITNGFSTGLNTIQLKSLISTKWQGGNFSTRVWKDKDSLLTMLEKLFKRGVAMGKNPKAIANELSNRLDVSYRSCERLCRTEAMHLYNEATYESYKTHGVTKYRYMTALDERTCEICGALDGKIFDLSDKEEGVNYPILHPNCRCTTSAWSEVLDKAGAYKGERVARDKNGTLFMVPAEMTYTEWKERYGV